MTDFLTTHRLITTPSAHTAGWVSGRQTLARFLFASATSVLAGDAFRQDATVPTQGRSEPPTDPVRFRHGPDCGRVDPFSTRSIPQDTGYEPRPNVELISALESGRASRLLPASKSMARTSRTIPHSKPSHIVIRTQISHSGAAMFGASCRMTPPETAAARPTPTETSESHGSGPNLDAVKGRWFLPRGGHESWL